MRLLILTQAVDRTDANLGFFHGWIEAFAKRVEHVTVICLREGEHALPKNITVLSLGKEKGTSKITRVVRFYTYIYRERKNYDAVFVHMNPEYVVLGGLLWKLWNKTVVLWYTHKSVTLKLRMAVLWVKYVASASIESFRLATPKLRVIGHAIDTTLFNVKNRTPKTDTMRIATVGRISASKHILEMLEALDVLHAQGRKFTFSIVGEAVTKEDATYEKKVREILDSKPYVSSVHLLGPIAHATLPAFLASQDVCLNLSTTGSVDKAVLEALAAGLSVVTSNEAFTDGTLPVWYAESKPEAVAEKVVSAFSSSKDPVTSAEVVTRLHGMEQGIGRILALYEK